MARTDVGVVLSTILTSFVSLDHVNLFLEYCGQMREPEREINSSEGFNIIMEDLGLYTYQTGDIDRFMQRPYR